MATPDFNQLLDDFEFLDDWEERYKYVIELGRMLPPIDDRFRTPEYKVQGCASQVWLISNMDSTGPEPTLVFEGDSDALIVKGLIAILRILLSGKQPADILNIDVQAKLEQLGLHEALTPQRSNGLASMIRRIKTDAARMTG